MKRTLQNCTLIKKCVTDGIGTPKQYDNKCEGYTLGDGEEPVKQCKKCKLNENYQENYMSEILKKYSRNK